MPDIINEETSVLIDELVQKAKVGPVEVPRLFLSMVNSVLWRMVTGRTIEKQARTKLTEGVRLFFKIGEFTPMPVAQVSDDLIAYFTIRPKPDIRLTNKPDIRYQV